jgi:hypothetical protein
MALDWRKILGEAGIEVVGYDEAVEETRKIILEKKLAAQERAAVKKREVEKKKKGR